MIQNITFNDRKWMFENRAINHRSVEFTRFAAWINAGITARQFDEGVLKARAEATEPIVNLVLYVDRVLSNQAAPRASPARQTLVDVRDATIAGLTGRNRHDAEDRDTIDIDAHRVE